ncbi:MAG: hypothetical protein ACI4QY_02615 [Oscillospiraceae bacterium]
MSAAVNSVNEGKKSYLFIIAQFSDKIKSYLPNISPAPAASPANAAMREIKVRRM